MRTWVKVALAGGVFGAAYLLKDKPRYRPGSPEQIRLFATAARQAGLPVEWASSEGLVNILERESDGWVGRPNFTYGDRAKNKLLWPAVWAELRRGVKATKSSATGLGQLLLANVDKYYPRGRADIGNARGEAAGMLRYIQDRYGTPEHAWELYGKLFAGY
jgi:hypothetical protein